MDIQKAILPVAIAVALAQTAFADNSPSAVKGAQAIFDKLGNGQAHITKSFDGPPGSGLTGLAVSLGEGRNMVAYTTADGKYIIVGAVFGSDGNNYSLAAAQKYLPPPPPPPNVGKNFNDLSKTHTFLWGKASAKKEIWALEDPDCIFCNKFSNEIKPFVDSGEVKVHVIMAGFLKPDSLGKAAAILGAKDPAQAYEKDESDFNASEEEGGIKPDTSNQKAVDQVKANNEWMRSHGIGGTPYILYRNKEGKPSVMPGYPSDIKGLLDQVQGGSSPVPSSSSAK